MLRAVAFILMFGISNYKYMNNAQAPVYEITFSKTTSNLVHIYKYIYKRFHHTG